MKKPVSSKVNHRHHTLEFQLRALNQAVRFDLIDQLFAQRKQHGRIARRVLQLGFRQFKFPIAQSLALIDGFVEIASGDRLQPMTFFDVSGRNELARQ
jgi:hypothetical protein